MGSIPGTMEDAGKKGASANGNKRGSSFGLGLFWGWKEKVVYGVRGRRDKKRKQNYG